jgi:hypothetical protein
VVGDGVATNCDSPWVAAFPSPGACGYPDPSYGNVGVPPRTKLTSSGTITIRTAGAVVNGMDVTGEIIVAASNVTITNTRVNLTTGGCGLADTCGNALVFQEPGYSNLTLSHVELASSPGVTVEHAVKMYGGGMLRMEYVYQHGDVDALCWCPAADITDSYSIVHLAIADDHLENIYSESSDVVVNHSVLLNSETTYTQGNIFAQTAAGAGVPCDNHFSLTNNLFAGGGHTLDLCAHSTDVGTASLDVENNRFARCITPPMQINGDYWHCAGGADQYGYAPFSGVYAPYADMYCSSGQTTWTGNKWDNNSKPIDC